MNIQQLRAFAEVVRQNMSISKASAALFASQPGISRQLRELEEELGVTLLARSQNRIIGLTDVGKSLIDVVRSILDDVERIKLISQDFTESRRGNLVIATTHSHARYSLPAVVKRFRDEFPLVQLNLLQGNPLQCAQMVAKGSASIGIAAEVESLPPEVVVVTAFRLKRIVIAANGHPILATPNITLEDIAKFPLITYDHAYVMQTTLQTRFDLAHLRPSIVLKAIDADVIKTYVELGLGVAVVSSMVYDPARDHRIGARDVTGLFEPGRVNIYLRRGSYLRNYVLEFVTAFAPHLSVDSLARHATGALDDHDATKPAPYLMDC